MPNWDERRSWIREHAAEFLERDDRCWYKHPQGYQQRVLPGHTVCRSHLEQLRNHGWISAGAFEDRNSNEQLRLF